MHAVPLRVSSGSPIGSHLVVLHALHVLRRIMPDGRARVVRCEVVVVDDRAAGRAGSWRERRRLPLTDHRSAARTARRIRVSRTRKRKLPARSVDASARLSATSARLRDQVRERAKRTTAVAAQDARPGAKKSPGRRVFHEVCSEPHKAATDLEEACVERVRETGRKVLRQCFHADVAELTQLPETVVALAVCATALVEVTLLGCVQLLLGVLDFFGLVVNVLLQLVLLGLIGLRVKKPSADPADA